MQIHIYHKFVVYDESKCDSHFIQFNPIINAFKNLKMFINLGPVLLSISFYHPSVLPFSLDPFWDRRRYKDKLINSTYQNTENTFALPF